MASNDPNANSTLGAMKLRIADEIARDDLTSQIVNAINDAISCYNNERFYFNETRNLTFPSVAGQDFYTVADLPDMPNILDIDYIYCFINNYPYEVTPSTPAEMEALSVANITLGQPYRYVWYQSSLRFYPMPMQSGWLFRIAAAISSPLPVDDNDASTPWSTDMERLIRSRAKYELALHVLNDDDLARRMGGTTMDADGNPTGGAAGDAFQQLKQKTNRLLSMGPAIVAPMAF